MTAIADYAGERWTPKERLPMAAPGQLRATEQYRERFANYDAEVARPYKGITTDGNAVPGLYRLEAAGVSTRPIREAAEAFLASLTDEQRGRALYAVDAPEWRKWHGLFTTLFRHGVMLEELGPTQHEKALALLRATLSERGFAATQDIRKTNELVREFTGRYVDFGAGVYWLSVMGTPSDTQPWGWQIDGHHINVSCFVLGDQMVMTPCFLGAEPTNVRTGRYAGIRLFADEEADAVALMQALSPAQRLQAIVGDTLRIDLFTGFFRDNYELAYQGTRVREFSAGQQQLITKLIGDYAGYILPGHDRVRLAEVRRYLEETWFGWVGGYEDEAPFYYRIHSPVILIEFTHIPGIALTGSEPSRNHIHTVVRTPNGNDYGKDLLRQHLERSHLG